MIATVQSVPPQTDTARPTIEEAVVDRARETLDNLTLPPPARLYQTLRLLAKYRCQSLQQALIGRLGTSVQAGPFAGMRLLDHSAEGCYLPKLLGSYEEELHPIIESWSRGQYSCVVNVGAAEGFYAVGLARLLPTTPVFAYELNPYALSLCAQTAARNLTTEKLVLKGALGAPDLRGLSGQRALVVCDIEGAEDTLFDSQTIAALSRADVLIETHPCGRMHTRNALGARFKDSHSVRLVPQGPRNTASYPVLAPLNQLDQLLALWEWRSVPTPWLWLQARNS